MPFVPPSYLPKLPFDPPDDIAVPEFIFNDKYGRLPLSKARNFFTCGFSGKTYSAQETLQRVEKTSRGLQKILGWRPNQGTEWDKIVAIFSVNTIDTNILQWGVLNLGGLNSPANAQYSQQELEHQLRDSGAKVVFTCLPLLKTALGAAQTVGIPKDKVFLLDTPKELIGDAKPPPGFQSLDDVIALGSKAEAVEKLKWSKGEGARRVAFLCYSSGTSGLPKGVKISHRNVIANTLQMATFDRSWRQALDDPKTKAEYQDNVLGLLPMSHIYSLVVCCHLAVYLGDGVIVLPKFEVGSCMGAIQKFKIGILYLVPPIIIAMAKNSKAINKGFDLSAIKTVFSGAAPLGAEIAKEFQEAYPHASIRQGYGMTETSTVVTSTTPTDGWFGSIGSLIPGHEARLIAPDGSEITALDTPGELLVRGPNVVLGYLNNPKADAETFVNGWLHTGDEAKVSKHPKSGYEHLFITDRIKELIKTKGHQVAPAELEAHLLSHPAVADCTVIPVPDEAAGEVPKAFVVKSANAGGIEDNDAILARELQKYVEQHKSRYKWLKGGVEFIDVIPKSPSGKILRRVLKDQEKAKRLKAGAKM